MNVDIHLVEVGLRHLLKVDAVAEDVEAAVEAEVEAGVDQGLLPPFEDGQGPGLLQDVVVV